MTSISVILCSPARSKKCILAVYLKKGTFLKELPLWKTLPHTLLYNSGAIPVATPIELYQITKCRQEIEAKRVTAAHQWDQWGNEARGDGVKNDNMNTDGGRWRKVWRNLFIQLCDSESVYVTQTHVRQAAVPISSLVVRFNQSKCSICQKPHSNSLVILVCVSQKGNPTPFWYFWPSVILACTHSGVQTF